MLLQQVQLEEVQIIEVSDETLEQMSGLMNINASYSYCTICSCNLQACG